MKGVSSIPFQEIDSQDLVSGLACKSSEQASIKYVHIIRKGEYLYKGKKLTQYIESTAEELFDSLEENTFGYNWIHNNCYDIYSQSGKNHLEGIHNKLGGGIHSTKELEEFILDHKVLQLLKGHFESPLDLEIDIQYKLFFKDQQIIRKIDDLLEKNHFTYHREWILKSEGVEKDNHQVIYALCWVLYEFTRPTKLTPFFRTVFTRFNYPLPKSFEKGCNIDRKPKDEYIQPFQRLFASI